MEEAFPVLERLVPAKGEKGGQEVVLDDVGLLMHLELRVALQVGGSEGPCRGGGEVDLGILDEPPESLELTFRELAVLARDVAVQKRWNGEQVEDEWTDVGVGKVRDVGKMKQQVERFVERQVREQGDLLGVRLVLDLLAIQLAEESERRETTAQKLAAVRLGSASGS